MTRFVLPLLAMLVTVAQPALAKTWVLSGAQESRVEQGEILTYVEESDEPIRTVTSVGRVNHGAHDVYLVMTDFKNFPRIYNGIRSVSIDDEHGNHVVQSYDIKAPWPLPGRTVTVETTLDPRHYRFSWHSTAGSMKVYDGRVTAVPAGDRACTVYYSAKVDPGYAFVPHWFVTFAQSRVLPSVIQAVRDTLNRHVGPYWAAGVERPAFSEETDTSAR
jgi:uncharacterized membrane protein